MIELWSHFRRYEMDQPVIFRFDTRAVLEANPYVKFCRLNSRATRANSYLGGKPPERGPNTFQTTEEFKLSVNQVAEVTFEERCTINGIFSFSDRPDGTSQLAAN